MQIGDKAEAVRQSVAAVVAGRLSSTLSGIVSAKVMADKRLAGMMDTRSLPFDAKRMIYGGFESLGAKWTVSNPALRFGKTKLW